MAREEYVLALEVSVEDLAVVNVLQAEANLSEPLEHLRLTESASSLLFDPVLEVAAYHILENPELTISEVHDDAELSALGLKDLDKLDDVGVREDLKDLGLLDGLLALGLAHLADVYLLHDTLELRKGESWWGYLVRGAFDEEGLAERAFSE